MTHLEAKSKNHKFRKKFSLSKENFIHLPDLLLPSTSLQYRIVLELNDY
jgi:hypothetical protein